MHRLTRGLSPCQSESWGSEYWCRAEAFGQSRSNRKRYIFCLRPVVRQRSGAVGRNGDSSGDTGVNCHGNTTSSSKSTLLT